MLNQTIGVTMIGSIQSRRLSGVLGMVALAFAAGVALADTLSDFQKAVAEEGCASIPYTSLRSECNASQAKVNEYCKGGMGEISCSSIGALSGIRSNIAGIQSKLKALEGDRKALEKKLAGATDSSQKSAIQKEIATIDRSAADLEAKVGELETRADKDLAVIEQRLTVAQGCVQHRKTVQDIFQQASTKAAAETDDEVEALAEQLIAMWTEERPGHLKTISDYEGAVRICQDKL